jgi:hypothetical protein
MEQDRRARRLELSFPVLVESGGEVRRLMASDVSERGMLFLSHEPYPVGGRLRVTFGLPSTDVELTALAEVVHVGWHPAGHFRVGLRFLEFERGEIHPPLRCLPC